jgi:hypothetical protein
MAAALLIALPVVALLLFLQRRFIEVMAGGSVKGWATGWLHIGRPFEGWTHQKIMKGLGPIWNHVHERLDQPLLVADDGVAGHDFGAFTGLLRARGLLRGTIDAEKESRCPSSTARRHATSRLNRTKKSLTKFVYIFEGVARPDECQHARVTLVVFAENGSSGAAPDENGW